MIAATLFAVPATAAPIEEPLWVGSQGPTTGGTFTVLSDGSVDLPAFSYNVPDPGEDNGESGSWEFATVATTNGYREIAWDYDGFHAFFQVTVGLKAFVERPNGEGFDTVSEVTLLDEGPKNDGQGPPSGGFSYSGTADFAFAPGDRYGFRLDGSNFDTNENLNGVLAATAIDGYDISVSSFDDAVAPGSTTTISVQFTGEQSLDEISANLGEGLSYVPGSSVVVQGPSGEGTDPVVGATIERPDDLYWFGDGEGFFIDPTDGLELQFDVLVSDIDPVEVSSTATVDAGGVVGGFRAADTAEFLVLGVEVTADGDEVPVGGSTPVSIRFESRGDGVSLDDIRAALSDGLSVATESSFLIIPGEEFPLELPDPDVFILEDGHRRGLVRRDRGRHRWWRIRDPVRQRVLRRRRRARAAVRGGCGVW